ncbi:FHA domain-containing protein, partial [Streptomyces sp. NPDC049577]|uniref:FHA domain-containing protein n=1 Tax=Streptomyces sp. NPDC049577 TaxID=3155153 RepID=UPI003447ED90
MQIRLTVLGPLSGHHTACACDVLVTAPSGTALAGVTSGLAAAVAAAGSDLGTGAVVVYAGADRLDPQRCALGEPPLIDGAVLSLSAPAGPERHAGVPLPGAGIPGSTARLHVVSGPDAGGVHLLHGGEARVGRSAEADIPLDDPDVSRLHCAVVLGEDGSVTLHDLGSTNGTTLDGSPVPPQPTPLPPGALLRLGESALTLHTPADGPSPALPVTPDGEGHVRVPLPPSPSPGEAGAYGGPAGRPPRVPQQSAGWSAQPARPAAVPVQDDGQGGARQGRANRPAWARDADAPGFTAP